LLFLADAVRLIQARYAPGKVFNAAKALVVAAATVAFLVWFFGFMVVAREWFAMWQSKSWNGQEAAFRVSLPDGDLAPRRSRGNVL
jgi:predicted small integral membrane protein